MSKLTDRTSYLKGLADGMNLSREKDANKLILEILDVLRDMAAELEKVRADVDDLDEYVANMDEDLADLTEAADDCCGHHHHHPHHHPHHGYYPGMDDGDDEEDDEEDDADLLESEDGDDSVIYYECPFCHKEMHLTLDEVNFSEDMPCPACGKPLFPEGFDEEQQEDAAATPDAASFPQDDDVYGGGDEEDAANEQKEAEQA